MQAHQKVANKSDIQHEENLLEESATREQTLLDQIASLEKELKDSNHVSLFYYL